MQIHFNDLFSQYRELQVEIDAAIKKTIENSDFVRGDEINRFEKAFSSKTGSLNCISCANGTDALRIAMYALGMPPESEVIVPAHTWISTAAMVTEAGGVPVFCDTMENDFIINHELIADLITPKTVGIIPVHLYGQPSDMVNIMNIAKKFGLWVIEDCAQAHFAKIKDKQVGQFGHAATYSFYPGKNLGAMGDGGAITTNDPEIAIKMRRFANHGGLVKGEHLIQGINSRLDTIQAAILRIKLSSVDEWHEKRRSVASLYSKALNGLCEIILPCERPGTSHAWHLYVIKTKRREALREYLSENGIPTLVNYPTALPLLPCFPETNMQHRLFQKAYANQDKILSLPMHPYLTVEMTQYITNHIHQFFEKE